MASELSAKHQAFADEYLQDMNATRAYLTVYPDTNANSAAASGRRLLLNAKIIQYLENARASMSKSKIASAEEILSYLTSVVRGESEAEIVVIEGTGEGRSEARRMKKAPEEKEKLKAAEMLGKHKGMWNGEKGEQVQPIEIVFRRRSK